MKKFFNIKNLYIKVLVIIFVIYVVSVLINQQSKLNNYKEAQAYYQQKIDEAQTYQESLKALKDNINLKGYKTTASSKILENLEVFSCFLHKIGEQIKLFKILWALIFFRWR